MSKNEISVYNAGILSAQVRFDDLNAAIEKLGTASKKLSDKEKELGVKTLVEWEQGVIERINSKEREMNRVIQFIEDGTCYGYNDSEKEAMEGKLADITGTDALLQKAAEARELVKDCQRKQPMMPHINPDLSINENDLERSKWRVEETKWQNEVRKVAHVADTAYDAWLRKVRVHPEVKKFVAQVKTFRERAKAYSLECKEKASLARINISIGNDDARANLLEIMNFSKKFA